MRMLTVWRVGAVVVMCGAMTAPAVLAQSQRPRNDPSGRSGRNDQSDSDRGPKETETIDRTIALPANGLLRLRNFSGDVHITGTSGRDVVMRATRRAARERLDHVKLDVETSGSTVTITANKQDDQWQRDNHDNNVVDTTFELQVPASARLDVDAFSSNVTIEGMTNEQHLKTFSGDLKIRGLAAAIDAETFSGAIRVQMPANAKGSVSFHSFSGDLDSSLAISSTSRRSRTIEGSLPGGPGPRLDFRTFSGDVAITQSGS